MTPLEAMKADAARCNAAMRRSMGVGAQAFTRPKPKFTAASLKRAVLDAATATPMTAAQLAEKAGVSIDGARKAVQRLAMSGDLILCETVFVPASGGRAKTYRRKGA
jgi:hypothetical protein